MEWVEADASFYWTVSTQTVTVSRNAVDRIKASTRRAYKLKEHFEHGLMEAGRLLKEDEYECQSMFVYSPYFLSFVSPFEERHFQAFNTCNATTL